MRIALPYWDRNGYLFATASVALATALFVLGRDLFTRGQWSLLYLLLIVFIAILGGVRAALAASVLAFFTWNFFLIPPYHTLLIHDSEDILSLLVFLIVGMLMGIQTGRMRAREADALALEEETAGLNRLSAMLVSVSSTQAMAGALLPEVQRMTGATSAMLWLSPDDDSDPVAALPGVGCSAPQDHLVRWVLAHHRAIGLSSGHAVMPAVTPAAPPVPPPGAQDGDLYLPVQSTSGLEGVLYVGGAPVRRPAAARATRLLTSIANLVAGFLERQRLEIAASRSEALREAERMKSTLVSSVSHELKTPLAAVTATVTSLLEGDVIWDPRAVRVELEAVNVDLEQLNDNISALINLSRLKADAWTAQRDWYEFGEILGAVISAFPERHRRRLILSVPEEVPPLHVDFQQWAQALKHLLENAFTYAPADTPVLVGASATPDELRISVEDHGPGIIAEERERIFEQFFRGSAAATAPAGAGLGLAITAEIVHMSGGRIWVEKVQPQGVRFMIALPRTAMLSTGGEGWSLHRP